MQSRANELLSRGNSAVRYIGWEAALKASTTHEQDFVMPYVEDLANVIDLEAIRSAGVKSVLIRWGAPRRPTGSRWQSATASTSPS